MRLIRQMNFWHDGFAADPRAVEVPGVWSLLSSKPQIFIEPLRRALMENVVPSHTNYSLSSEEILRIAQCFDPTPAEGEE